MASRINADSSNGLQLVSDSSGEVQIQSNGVTVATINSSGLSMNSGTLAGNGPAFSAYGTATVSNGTWTKISCNTEEFDTASCFNNTGSTVGSNPPYSFLPTVAGYYQVNGQVAYSSGAAVNNAIVAIYKNGTEFKRGNRMYGVAPTFTQPVVSSLIYLNGSTDYIALHTYQDSGGSVNTEPSGQATTYFQAVLVRAA